jgi:hypothetical protein
VADLFVYSARYAKNLQYVNGIVDSKLRHYEVLLSRSLKRLHSSNLTILWKTEMFVIMYNVHSIKLNALYSDIMIIRH